MADAGPEESIEALLGAFAHFGVELGLERIQRLLAALGQPQQRVPVIHVAGTNGKGSVCAYLSTILTIAGYRVGRYTSPHLVDWTERICLNNQPIAPDVLRSRLAQVQAAIDPRYPSPTQFEVITAAAWLHFAESAVDVAVMEVGLGGRLDATNVCDRPLATIITSISRDHWQRLGPTLADIAREKAGILKPNCPAIVGELPAPAIAAVEQRRQAVSCPIAWVPAAQVLPAAMTGQRGQPQYQYLPPRIEPLTAAAQFGQEAEADSPFTYELSLLGAPQAMNSALAIAAIRVLQAQGWSIGADQLRRGLATTQWAGRLQWAAWRGRSLLIDGAHNEASAQNLGDFVDQTWRSTPAAPPVTWVMGMLDTKDHPAVLRPLLRPGDTLYLVPVPDHQTAAPAALATLAQSLCPGLAACVVRSELAIALDAAVIPPPAAPPPLVVLCGSLYLVGHFLRLTATPVSG